MIPLWDDGTHEIVKELHKVKGYPADTDRDMEYVRDLKEQFPQLDLVEQARQWRAYMLDYDQKRRKGVNYRARFRVWCSKANDTRGRASSRRSNGSAARRKSLGAVPASPSAFTDSGGRLEE